MKLLVATTNPGKLKELRRLFAELPVEILSPADVGPLPEVVEDGDTFASNAEKKARQIGDLAGVAVLADDSGLEVTALGGAPGVHSARYAGPNASDSDNNEKLLKALANRDDRLAQFRCVLALYDPTGALGTEVHFEEGICRGSIGTKEEGELGFGYDPLFSPEGDPRTMAQLAPDEKGSISHRGRAARKMAAYLEARLLDL